MGTCSVTDCVRPAVARGWCRPHWKRWRRNGDPVVELPRKRRDPAERFWCKVDRVGGPEACWPWLASRDELGYGFFRLTPGQNMVKAHRAVLILSGVLLGETDQVLHACDNPPCVNPSHLRVGSHQENMQDRNAKGRTTLGRTGHHGEGSGRAAKLMLAEVREIRQRYAAGGISQAALGAEYGISQTQVGRICRETRWAYDQ